MGHYLDQVERLKRELTMDELVPHHTGRKPIRCPLPGHDDKTGSFMVYTETNSWWCPSHPHARCGGSPLDYIMLAEHTDFKGAVRHALDLKGWDMTPPTEEEKEAEAARHKREETLSALVRYAHGQLFADTEVAKETREYLAGRGFHEDLLREHQVGLVNLEKLYQVRGSHPLLADFSQADFEEAGLRNAKGSLLFRDTRAVFPLLARQRAVGLTCRALPGSTDPRKFVHLAGQAAGLWNKDALFNKDREVVVGEGVPDALTLAGWRIPAVGNLGLEVTKNAHLFAHLKVVTLVWDNDKAGRSRVVIAGRAIQAALRDGEVRILHMPGEKDINAWAMSGGTKEELLDLLGAAPDLITYQVRLLPDVKAGERMTRDAQALLHELLADLVDLDKNLQDTYLATIAKRVGSTPATLKGMIRAKAKSVAPQHDDQKEDKNKLTPVYKDKRPIVAALDFDCQSATPRANIGILMDYADNDGNEIQIPTLIEVLAGSDGIKAKLVPYRDRQVGDPELVKFPDEEHPLWSRPKAVPFSVEAFLENPAACTPNTAQLFQRIRDVLSKYLWYPDVHEFDIIATWAMMTYVFPVFESIGFLHFNGISGSGKSLCMDMLAGLTFNAAIASNISSSALYRLVDACRSTMFIDEAEKLSYPKAGSMEEDLRLILNASYKKNGVTKRTNKETGRTETFRTFGPKAFGSIKEIDPTFGSRCIIIRSLKKQKYVRLLDSSQNATDLNEELSAIRNELHCWALTHFHLVHEIFTRDLVGCYLDVLHNREHEIWMPLISIATLVDRASGKDETCSLVDTLLKAQQSKSNEREAKARRENLDIVIIKTVLELITGGDKGSYQLLMHPSEYSTKKLTAEVHTILTDNGTWDSDRKFIVRHLLTPLKNNHVITETDHHPERREGGTRVGSIKLNPEKLKEALQRLQGLDTEDEASLPTSEPAQAAPTQPKPTQPKQDDLPF